MNFPETGYVEWTEAFGRVVTGTILLCWTDTQSVLGLGLGLFFPIFKDGFYLLLFSS